MKVIYDKQPVKTLAKMPLKMAQQIREKVSAFAARDGKPNLDIETLKGVERGFRLRQGGWRVLMLMERDALRVTAIKPRGDAYK